MQISDIYHKDQLQIMQGFRRGLDVWIQAKKKIDLSNDVKFNIKASRHHIWIDGLDEIAIKYHKSWPPPLNDWSHVDKIARFCCFDKISRLVRYEFLLLRKKKKTTQKNIVFLVNISLYFPHWADITVVLVTDIFHFNKSFSMHAIYTSIHSFILQFVNCKPNFFH